MQSRYTKDYRLMQSRYIKIYRVMQSRYTKIYRLMRVGILRFTELYRDDTYYGVEISQAQLEHYAEITNFSKHWQRRTLQEDTHFQLGCLGRQILQTLAPSGSKN